MRACGSRNGTPRQNSRHRCLRRPGGIALHVPQRPRAKDEWDALAPRPLAIRNRCRRGTSTETAIEDDMNEHGERHTGTSFAEDLIDESPDALLALSLDGRILAWNRGAEVIFGYN